MSREPQAGPGQDDPGAPDSPLHAQAQETPAAQDAPPEQAVPEQAVPEHAVEAQAVEAQALAAQALLAQALAETAPGPQAAGEVRQYREQGRGLFGIQAFFTVVIFSIFVITFIVQAFQIPSPSMENTLLIGDFLLVDKLHFAGEAAPDRMLPYGPIQRGDIVVFYYPVDPSQFLVKRVIGLPGDHLRLRHQVVYVNGVALRENYVIHKQWAPDAYRDNFPSYQNFGREIDRRWRYQMQNYLSDGELVVPPGQYFVMGDNRDQSLDSRYWGFVPRANVVGRPLVIYLSVRGGGQGGSSDKLLHSGLMAHLLHLARWDRMFRLVR